MDSRRWMDVDGSWVYSTNPRRQTDSHLKYSTLPGRNNNAYRGVPDMSRRPADSSGKYGTIPGRYVNRGPVRDQLPYRQWSPSRVQKGAVLQDSTNWEPFLPLGSRGASVAQLEHNDSRIRERFWYDWDIPTRNALEHEKRRHKFLGNLEKGNLFPSGKGKQKGKLMEVDSVYGEWHSEYKLANKMKAAKRDEWEPLPYPPKALQNQMLSQKKFPELPPAEKTKSGIPTAALTQEKKSWWSKLVKHSKSIPSDVVNTQTPLERTNRDHNDQSYLMNYGGHRLNGLKENVPHMRKRKVPPPYVPPPSYNYPHRTFPISKNNPIKIQGFNQEQTSELGLLNERENIQENKVKLPRYSVDQWKAPRINVLHTNARENREEVEKKLKRNTTHHNILQDRKLPRTCSTWAGSISDDYLDHIYEVVEGGGFPTVSNVPTGQKTNHDLGSTTDEMNYGTVAISRDPTRQHTLPKVTSKGTHDRTEAIKNKNISFYSQRQMPQLDERPPIPLHGIKLPRELGFSYTSGIFQPLEKSLKGNYSDIKEPDNYEPDDKWKRPLRVISSKEPKLRVHSHTAPYTSKHGWYSHTLPLNKDYVKTQMQKDIGSPDSTSKSVFKQEAILPKWQEPGKISTLPSRGRDHSRWRGEDNLKLEMKHNLFEPSIIQSNKLGRRRNATEEALENSQVPSSKESDGFFVIDATCVVVKAEYIFPPIMEQVTFLHAEPLKEEKLSSKKHLATHSKNETKPILLPCLKSSSNSTMKTTSDRSHSKTFHFKEVSKERVVPSLTERAVRILGLSVGDIESLIQTQDHSHANVSVPVPDKTYQDPKSHEKEHNFLGENCFTNNRNDYKLRDCNGLPCIQEVSEVSGDYDAYTNIQKSDDCNIVVNLDDLGSKENVSFCDTHTTESTKCTLEPFTLEIYNTEVQPKTPEANHANVQVPQTLTKTSPMIESDICFCEGNSLDMSPNTVPDRMTEIIITKQCQDVLEPRLTEETCRLSNKMLQICVPKRLEDSCILDAKTTKCFEENGISGVEHDSEKEHLKPNKESTPENQSQKRDKYVIENVQSCSPAMSHENAYPHSLHSRHKGKDSYIYSQIPPLRPQVKAYTRRPNYYAKDLREAVSRIRRHTAPDSDTDEDIDQSVPELVNHEEQVPDESLTTCSSDTSDSEVTVIMCEGEKQTDEVSMSTNISDIENMNEDGTMEGLMETPSPPADPQGGEIAAQCNGSHEQEPVFDLNSCIKEILQELNKTEQEFFSSNEDQLKDSGNSHIEEVTDDTSSK